MSNALIPVKDLFDYINMREVEIQAHMSVMLSKAVESGLDLLDLKERIPHGEFEQECEKYCVLKERQRQDYMRVAKNQDSLPKARSSALSISAALQYLSSPEEVKAEVNERLDNGEEVTASEVRRLKLANDSLKKMSDESRQAQQEALAQKEQWRQQSIDHKHRLDDMAMKLSDKDAQIEAARTRLKDAKSPKEIIVHVTDDEKALESIRSVHEADLKKKDEQIAHEKRMAEILKQKAAEIEAGKDQAIQRGIAERLENDAERIKNHQAELDRLSKQETSIRSRNEHLLMENAKLESINSSREEHRRSLDEFHKAVLQFGVIVCPLWNEEMPHQDDLIEWTKYMREFQKTLDAAHNRLDELIELESESVVFLQ